MKIVFGIKSPLWDVCLFAAITAAIALVPALQQMSDSSTEVMLFVAWPLAQAAASAARHKKFEDSIVNLGIAGLMVLICGIFLFVAAGAHSYLYHPEHVLCGIVGGIERCAWNPTGTSAGLFGGSMITMLIGMVVFGLAAACASTIHIIGGWLRHSPLH